MRQSQSRRMRKTISIHSLRMEGDVAVDATKPRQHTFQSTPSAWRETISTLVKQALTEISIHSLRMEGDTPCVSLMASIHYFNPLPPHGGRRDAKKAEKELKDVFQSTPSAWRETWNSLRRPGNGQAISIHSLRMEGDRLSFVTNPFLTYYFNPLPPHGGRPSDSCAVFIRRNFNPLPPHGGRPTNATMSGIVVDISIHSLRMEGDGIAFHPGFRILPFQSTPSAWRETHNKVIPSATQSAFQSTPSAWRETSDRRKIRSWNFHFNPLPPHGGRLNLSTEQLGRCDISIHSLRMEGDVFRV